MIVLSSAESRSMPVIRNMCAVTGPATSDALSVTPAGWVSDSTAIVMVGSVPPNPGGTAPATLFATIMPTPPAACTLCALITNVHRPRSTSTILPVMPVSGSHASVNVPTPSFASTTSAVMSKLNGPKAAVPAGTLPPGVNVRDTDCGPNHVYNCMRGRIPSEGDAM